MEPTITVCNIIPFLWLWAVLYLENSSRGGREGEVEPIILMYGRDFIRGKIN